MIESLKEYRNENIHSGERADSVDVYKSILQEYYRNLIGVCFNEGRDFSSIEGLCGFLDLVHNAKVDDLKEKNKMINKAIRFIS